VNYLSCFVFFIVDIASSPGSASRAINMSAQSLLDSQTPSRSQPSTSHKSYTATNTTDGYNSDDSDVMSPEEEAVRRRASASAKNRDSTTVHRRSTDETMTHTPTFGAGPAIDTKTSTHGDKNGVGVEDSSSTKITKRVSFTPSVPPQTEKEVSNTTTTTVNTTGASSSTKNEECSADDAGHRRQVQDTSPAPQPTTKRPFSSASSKLFSSVDVYGGGESGDDAGDDEVEVAKDVQRTTALTTSNTTTSTATSSTGAMYTATTAVSTHVPVTSNTSDSNSGETGNSSSSNVKPVDTVVTQSVDTQPVVTTTSATVERESTAHTTAKTAPIPVMGTSVAPDSPVDQTISTEQTETPLPAAPPVPFLPPVEPNPFCCMKTRRESDNTKVFVNLLTVPAKYLKIGEIVMNGPLCYFVMIISYRSL
jgi:hypothetical protein